MKKLTVLLLTFGILLTQKTVIAQTTKDTTKTHVKKVKQTTTAASTMQTAKADTATKKHKESKVATSTTTAATQTPANKTTSTKTTTTSATTTDPKVGTDAKGRTIYQGKKGGKYTLSASGNKEYIKP